MVTTSQKMTAEELLQMPSDDYRYELVQGELRKMSPSGHQHGRIAVNITVSLGNYVKEKKLGTVYAAETGFKIASDPDTVRAPDVAFVQRDRVKQVGESQGFWPGAPDLAVEVLSPSDVYAEVEEKVVDWLEAGCRMVIVVNPKNRTVTVYHSRSEIRIFSEQDILETGDVVPGWSMKIEEMFV